MFRNLSVVCLLSCVVIFYLFFSLLNWATFFKQQLSFRKIALSASIFIGSNIDRHMHCRAKYKGVVFSY